MTVPSTRSRVNPWVALFFTALLVTGLSLFRDYGISWDEIPTREFGQMYVAQQIPDIYALEALRAEKGFAWERHGPVFEIGLATMERVAAFSDIRSAFFARHFATFLVFALGVALFYAFCRRRFGTGLSLFASGMLVLTPLFFAHAFYNTKDVPFLTLFVATMLTLCMWLERPSWPIVIGHAVLTSMLVSTRILGLLAVGFTIVLTLLRHRDRAALIRLAAYAVLIALLLPLFWPVLRIDYWGVFSQAVLNASSNTLSPRSVMLWGESVSPKQLPWYYIPSWMLVTIPIPYLVLFVAGVAVVARRAITEWRELLQAPSQDLVVVCWFAAPLLMTIVLHPILYDGWRHLYFVYPALLYLGVCGADAIWAWSRRWTAEWPARRRAAVAAIGAALCLAPSVNFMATSHPFEHLYFNQMAGADLATARGRFDFDYWGLSYRPMLERLVRMDSSAVIKVRVENYPGVANSLMLVPSDRRRLQYVKSLEDADYFITNFRYPDDPKPDRGELFSLRIGTATIASLYKVPKR